MKTFKTGFLLVVSGALAAGVVLFLRTHVQYQEIVEDLSSWGSFFTVFGVIYAIVAGFLLVSVLNRYGVLNQTIEDELNAIECVRDFLVYLDDEQRVARIAIKRALAKYARSLSTKEWEEMTDPHTPMNSDTSEELYEVMRRGKGIQVRRESDSVVLSALVQNISEIARMRTRRIALANERLPPRLRILMLFMSIALVAGFVLLGVRGVFTHVFMLVTLTISIHPLYMVIEDLDHPFYGVWNINRAPLDELVKSFEDELRENQTHNGPNTLRSGEG